MLRTVKFINENFLALSAGATAFGSAAAVIFMAGYLVAFDSSLIWVIESTDIFKFILIASSLLVASLAFIGGASDFIKVIQFKGKKKYVHIGLLYAMIIAAYAFIVYQNYKIGNTDLVIYEVLNMMLILSVLTLIFMATDYWIQIRDENRTTSNQNFAIGIFALISIHLLGLSYGYKIKSDSKNIKEIVVKDKSNSETVFSKSKIIIFLSHHVIFKTEKIIHIIPSADVVRISSAPET